MVRRPLHTFTGELLCSPEPGFLGQRMKELG